MTIPPLSYHHGISPTPLLNATLGACLDRAAETWPDREAVVVRDQAVRLTFAALHTEVERVAAGLIALGLVPGERVGLWSPNRVEWVICQYATAKAGLILVNLNPGYRESELEFALNKVQCAAIICADRFRTTDYIGILRSLAPELAECAPGALTAARLPHLRLAIHFAATEEPGFLTLDAVRAMDGPAHRGRLAELAMLLEPDDPINIQFTSGTTGSPKAAALSHFGLVNNALFFAESAGIAGGERFCNPLPLYHVGGMVLGSIAGLLKGLTAIWLGEAFEPGAALLAVAEERCELLLGVPTMYVAMLNHPDFASFDLAPLRIGLIGGSPCPEEVMKRMEAAMGLAGTVIVYGMTELSGSSMQTVPDDTLARRVTTIGRPLGHMEIKLVDPAGRTVPHGEQGELCFRGFMVMRGYWGDPEKTAETIDAARWLHSGDLGRMDAEGYVTITGRSKDMVIRGGENIYPREVEEFLFSHPVVADVQVFGVPDPHWGEELCAWVRLRPGSSASEEEIRAFCRGRITHFKIPRHIRFVDAFPMTVTGKVQKFIMREAMVVELAQG
ncbi:MAG: AMP-binding protein [Alphaproteobacteria bacterium]|nr:AMP-binding protein [Alphaproteobacteria bacterium]